MLYSVVIAPQIHLLFLYLSVEVPHLYILKDCSAERHLQCKCCYGQLYLK